MKILVVHEVNYLKKIIYEFQILPEILSMLGHEVTVIDYDDSWKTSLNGRRWHLKTDVHEQVHRAYSSASVTVRRPGMIRFPIVSRISAAIASGLEVYRFLQIRSPDVLLLYGLPTVGVQSLLAARNFHVPVVFRSIDVLHQLVPMRALVPLTRVLERYLYNRVNAVIPVTLNLKKYILSYGVPESRVRVLPSGVDTEMFSPGPRNNRLLPVIPGSFKNGVSILKMKSFSSWVPFISSAVLTGSLEIFLGFYRGMAGQNCSSLALEKTRSA